MYQQSSEDVELIVAEAKGFKLRAFPLSSDICIHTYIYIYMYIYIQFQSSKAMWLWVFNHNFQAPHPDGLASICHPGSCKDMTIRCGSINWGRLWVKG